MRPVQRRTEGPVPVEEVMEFTTLPDKERSSSRRTAIRYAVDDPSKRREAAAVSGTSSVAARLLRGCDEGEK